MVMQMAYLQVTRYPKDLFRENSSRSRTSCLMVHKRETNLKDFMLLYHKFREIEHEKEANRGSGKERRERETQKPLSRAQRFNLSCVSYRQNQDAK